MTDSQSLMLTVNGQRHTLDVDPAMPLLYALRNHLGLTAAKFGCGLEQCGACAVLVDGVSTLSCASPVGAFVDRDIVTCEGLGSAQAPSAVQRAFAREGAGQCGYCIPGLVIAATGLLNAVAKPDAAQISAALQPHLCRCGSHVRIIDAVQRVAQAAP